MLLIVLFLSNCRHVRTSSQEVSKSISEYHVASESFVLSDIEYIFYKYEVSWDEARVICTSRRAHLVTFDAKTNIKFILRIVGDTRFVSESFWLGAQTDSSGSWYWISTQRRLEFEDMTYTDPLFHQTFEKSENARQCLSIDLKNYSFPVLLPSACAAQKAIICQRHREHAKKLIGLVTAVRVDEKEFTLYSGRATWSEAVLHCRHEGLQIAEVMTMTEAESIALIMLRTRPEAIENAWIGGYSDEYSWKWVTSGENITLASNLWGKNVKREKAGCLLLDKHLTDPPVYLQSRCDRNRDILCQKRIQNNVTGSATTAQLGETTARTTPAATYKTDGEVRKSAEDFKNTEEWKISQNDSEMQISTHVDKVSTRAMNDNEDTSTEISTYLGKTGSVTSATIPSSTSSVDVGKLFVNDVQRTEEKTGVNADEREDYSRTDEPSQFTLITTSLFDTVNKLNNEETTTSANDEDYYNYVDNDKNGKPFDESTKTTVDTERREDDSLMIVENDQNEVQNEIDATTEMSAEKSNAKPQMIFHFLSIRPYYAFEGPMNVDIAHNRLDKYARRWEKMKLKNDESLRRFHGAAVINDIIVQIVKLDCGVRARVATKTEEVTQ